MATAVLPEMASEVAPAFHPKAAREAQLAWAALPLWERLGILRRARHELAAITEELAAAISPELVRTPADTRVAEILPLLAACKFLEDQGQLILRVRKLGSRGLPFWLSGVRSEVHRVPFGRVLVIGPANYPLFLPGAQVLQALAAGNAVIWKPGHGGQAVAQVFAGAMARAGLPQALLQITGETVAAGELALQESPDKVFFTGSAPTGRTIMRKLAETLTPSVMELSGCDALIVLPSADLSRAVTALVFGMRLNGSATCMAPRRVLLVEASPARREAFLRMLASGLAEVDGIAVPHSVRQALRSLLTEAQQAGAAVSGSLDGQYMRPVLVTNARAEMRLAQEDVFAPILSVLEVRDEAEILRVQDVCPYALTASIFGDEAVARKLGAKLIAGTVIVNDLLVPTADPRLPFGGRRGSGFGATRGAEGLLEMTAAKAIAVRRGRTMRHYEATTAAHEGLFDGLITTAHAGRWTDRWRGLRQMVSAGRKLSGK